MFSRLLFLLTRLLMKPMYGLIRPRVSPRDLPAGVEFDPSKPVCYVLPYTSMSDRLVLARICSQNGLPVPTSKVGLPASGEAAVLYLPSLSSVGREIESKSDQALLDAVALAMQDENYDLQLVPVSLYWGRNPGSETSLFRVLFTHTDKPGRLRKLFIMLVQGRNSFINFSAPINFREFANRESDDAAAARKLARVLRVHFSRQSTATLGPSLATPEQIVESVLTTEGVNAALQAHATAEGVSLEEAKGEARKYVEEISANYSAIVIRVLDLFLSWVFRKMFSGVKVFHIDRLRSHVPDHGVIYMPAHRSHLDYLLISQTLYANGLVPPHIAAGINLNFWPVGGLLRRGGAFYIRRTFAGKKLYTAVFRAYVDVLLNRGYSVEFFPEGGRSRTGRLLQPKTGLLSMVLQSVLRNPRKPLLIVPVYVGYDRLVEAGSYAKELSGGAKRKESAGQLLKARKIFSSSYGSPYVSFGEPIKLNDYLDSSYPNWRAEGAAADGSPEWLHELVGNVANENMQRINASAVVNPVGLAAMILLSSPHMAISQTEMLSQIDVFLKILRTVPYSNDVVLPEGNAQEIFERAAEMGGLESIEHEWGNVITVSGNNAALLTYYRNNLMHLFALPALVARLFRHEERWSGNELIARCVELFPLLEQELFLHWPSEQAPELLKGVLKALVDMDLLIYEGNGMFVRPNVRTHSFAILVGLGRVLRETLERYCMANLLLAERPESEPYTRREFEVQAQLTAERMALLAGRNAPEYFDKSLFRGYLDTMIESGQVTLESRDEGESTLVVSQSVRDSAGAWVTLLGPDLQQNVLQLLNMPKHDQE